MLMYCVIVQMCVKIFLTLFMFASITCVDQFLPMKCVHNCVDELHKLVAITSIITQHRLEGASILSWGGSPTSFF